MNAVAQIRRLFRPKATPQIADGNKAIDWGSTSHEFETQRAHAQAWDQFCAWCRRHGLTSWPASYEVIAAWMDALAAGTDRPGGKPRALSTILQYAEAVASAHRIQGVAFNNMHPILCDARRRIRIGATRETKPVLAITRADIVDILKLLEGPCRLHSSPNARDLRDAAIFALSWSAALQIEELVDLDWIRIGDGSGCVTWRRLQSRGKQPLVCLLGPPDWDVLEEVPCINLPTDHYQVLKVWARLAGIRPGEPLFPSD